MNRFSEEAVTGILKNWEEVKISLEEHFRSRSKTGTKDMMDKGIALFIQFIAAVNQLPLPENLTLDYDQLTFKPVNVQERLEFIKSRPELFHSFRQLSELMAEQEKQFAKKKIMKKSPK